MCSQQFSISVQQHYLLKTQNPLIVISLLHVSAHLGYYKGYPKSTVRSVIKSVSCYFITPFRFVGPPRINASELLTWPWPLSKSFPLFQRPPLYFPFSFFTTFLLYLVLVVPTQGLFLCGRECFFSVPSHIFISAVWFALFVVSL